MKKKKIYRKQQVKTITNTPKSAPDFRTPPSPLSFSQSSVESNLSHFPYFNLIHLHVYCYIETCIQKKKNKFHSISCRFNAHFAVHTSIICVFSPKCC